MKKGILIICVLLFLAGLAFWLHHVILPSKQVEEQVSADSGQHLRDRNGYGLISHGSRDTGKSQAVKQNHHKLLHFFVEPPLVQPQKIQRRSFNYTALRNNASVLSPVKSYNRQSPSGYHHIAEKSVTGFKSYKRPEIHQTQIENHNRASFSSTFYRISAPGVVKQLQIGNFNTAKFLGTIRKSGTVTQIQRGNHNITTIWKALSTGAYLTRQIGDGNITHLDASHSGGIFYVTQRNNNNTVLVKWHSNGNIAVIHQNGNSNFVKVDQTALFTYPSPNMYSRLIVKQTGNRNMVNIQQQVNAFNIQGRITTGHSTFHASISSVVRQTGVDNSIRDIFTSVAITQTRQTQTGIANVAVINHHGYHPMGNAGYYRQKQIGIQNTAKIMGSLFAGTIKQIQRGDHNRSVIEGQIWLANPSITRQDGNYNKAHLDANNNSFGGSLRVIQHQNDNTARVTWGSGRYMTSISQNGIGNFAKVAQK